MAIDAVKIGEVPGPYSVATLADIENTVKIATNSDLFRKKPTFPGCYRNRSVGIGETFFRKYLPVSGRLLDIGCGAGRTTFALYRMGFRDIVGLDLSPGMIREDTGLHEFGDRIIEEGGRALFLHFPDREEVLECIAAGGMELIEDMCLPDITAEPETVRKHISDCRFWAVRKPMETAVS